MAPAALVAGSAAAGPDKVAPAQKSVSAPAKSAASAASAPTTPQDEDLTRRFVARIAAWRADDGEVLARARLLLIDGLALIAAGATEPGPRILSDLARAEASAAVASLVGQGFATALPAAARINGVALHVSDFEAMWTPANHAVSTILPALLALAEQREAEDGKPRGLAVLRGFAKGVEAQGRLRVASGEIDVPDWTVHPPAAVGSISAALACSAFLGLGEKETTMAVGIPSSRLGGGFSNVGSMTKALHCGDAAANGLQAALMAARGFSAGPDALGGPRGWGRTLFRQRFDPAPLLAPLQTPRIVSPGNAWKLFPAEFATHFAIAAAIDARQAIAEPGAVETVTVRVPNMPYLERPAPRSGLDGKFSWQYATALGLLDGKAELASYSDKRRFAADMERMLARIRINVDRSIPPRFDDMYVVTQVKLADGTLVERRCDAPLGHWRRPAPASAVKAKARGLLRDAYNDNVASRVLALLDAPYERLAIRPVMALLRQRI